MNEPNSMEVNQNQHHEFAQGDIQEQEAKGAEGRIDVPPEVDAHRDSNHQVICIPRFNLTRILDSALLLYQSKNKFIMLNLLQKILQAYSSN